MKNYLDHFIAEENLIHPNPQIRNVLLLCLQSYSKEYFTSLIINVHIFYDVRMRKKSVLYCATAFAVITVVFSKKWSLDSHIEDDLNGLVKGFHFGKVSILHERFTN